MDWKSSYVVFYKDLGCQASVKHLQPNKLEPRSEKVFFVGYPKEPKGNYFYNSSEKKMYVAREGIFLKNNVFLKTQVGEIFCLKKFKMISHKSLLQRERLFPL